MLSSFTFGKIIKTFLPGIIVLLALLLIADVAYQMLFPALKSSLFSVLEGRSSVTVFLTITVPLSILLGIFLNSVLWPTFIDGIRKKCKHNEDQSVQQSLKYFDKIARKNIEDLAKDAEMTSSLRNLPLRLRYYYLPVVKLENLNYIWESYFSWFEFQINILFALLMLLISILIAGCFYIVRYDLAASMNICALGFMIFLLIVSFLIVAHFLLVSARRNICRFDESLVSLIAGSLEFKKE